MKRDVFVSITYSERTLAKVDINRGRPQHLFCEMLGFCLVLQNGAEAWTIQAYLENKTVRIYGGAAKIFIINLDDVKQVASASFRK